jgi:outer membrane protein W
MIRTSLNTSLALRVFYGVAAVGASLLLGAVNGHTQSTDNIFCGLDAGGAFQDQVGIHSGFNGVTGDMKFSPGWAVGGDVGYNFSRFISADLNCGVIWNDISELGDQSLTGVASAHLVEIPILANAIFTYPIGHFKPYLGAGLGMAFGRFDSSNIPGADPNFHDTDDTFAYQGEIGLKYSLSQNIELGLAYRFVGTSSHSWTDSGISLNTDGTMAHLLEATFTWRF